MDALSTKANRADIRDALLTMPKSLYGIYDQAMERIDSQDDDHKDLGRRVLSWVSYAFRPLSLHALQEAVSTRLGDNSLDVDRLPQEKRLILVCAGLVVIDQEDNTVRLVHHSAQEYFDRSRESHFPDAALNIARACITYISFDVFSNHPLWRHEKRRFRQPGPSFFDYAIQYWPNHTRETTGPAIYHFIQKFISEHLDTLKLNIVTSRVPSHCTPLWIAASFNLEDIVRQLLEDGVGDDQQELGDVLLIASQEGYEGMVRLLLNNYDLVEEQKEAALQEAMSHCHHQIAQLLVEQGVNVNLANPWHDTPLSKACHDGDESLVQLLLEHGADVDAEGRNGTALQVAAESWHGTEQIVSLLLEKHANANAQGSFGYGTALQAAAYRGNEEIVRLLLSKGADVDALCGKYGTALQAASRGGNAMIVKLLLDEGTAVNTPGGEYGTALQAASYRHGNDYIVNLLLEKGADVNAQGGEYGTALQAAAYRGNNEIVSLLLDKGADVSALGGEYGTALQAASFGKNQHAVKILLDKGADVNTPGGRYGTALQAAAASYHRMDSEMIVKLLLDQGADVNALGGEYGTALQAASFSKDQNTVKLLLDKGADVNILGGIYGTALHAASYRGTATIVKLLLDKGADVNALLGGEYYYGTALQAAVASGDQNQLQIVQLLLQSGADVNAPSRGKTHRSVLQEALSRSKLNGILVRLLLEKGAVADDLGEQNNKKLAWIRKDEGLGQELVERGENVPPGQTAEISRRIELWPMHVLGERWDCDNFSQPGSDSGVFVVDSVQDDIEVKLGTSKSIELRTTQCEIKADILLRSEDDSHFTKLTTDTTQRYGHLLSCAAVK